ncbi:MAG: hypothetical protein ACREOZ_04360, partial [Gloeomargaritales cyanobacterium]
MFSPHSHIRGNGDKEGRFAELYEHANFSWDDGKRMTIPYRTQSHLPIARGFHKEKVDITYETAQVCV